MTTTYIDGRDVDRLVLLDDRDLLNDDLRLLENTGKVRRLELLQCLGIELRLENLEHGGEFLLIAKKGKKVSVSFFRFLMERVKVRTHEGLGRSRGRWYVREVRPTRRAGPEEQQPGKVWKRAFF
jgi:hypothetical protein